MGIKAYCLQLGGFGMDKEMLLVGHPSLSLMPPDKERSKTWYRCPSMGHVIEHPEGRILFDTGMNPNWNNEWPDAYKGGIDYSDVKPEEFLEQRLKSAGLGPDDFTHVVAGHLHVDHAGGLRVFQDAGAEIVVHEDEYHGVLSLEEDANFMCRADYEFLPRKKPTLVYGDQEILKGVKLISLPGHTWGTMGMLVQLEHTGSVLFTSDALFLHESYGPPAVGSMVSILPDKWMQSVEKVRRYATKHEAMLVLGHDESAIKQHADGTTDLVELKFHPHHVYE